MYHYLTVQNKYKQYSQQHAAAAKATVYKLAGKFAFGVILKLVEDVLFLIQRQSMGSSRFRPPLGF